MRYTLPGAVFVPAMDPSLGVRQFVFVAATASAVQQLIGDIELLEATHVARVCVIDDAIFQSEGAETRMLLVVVPAPWRIEIEHHLVRVQPRAAATRRNRS